MINKLQGRGASVGAGGGRMIKNDNKSTYGAHRASYVCGPLLARVGNHG